MINLFKKVITHKILLAIVLVVIIGGGYFTYKNFFSKQVTTQYITANVATSSIVSSLSGTGQVASLRTFSVAPKVSGDVTSAQVVNGQTVAEGDIIVKLDTREAARSLNDAKANLYNAQLDLQELISATDPATLLQAENSLADAQDSLVKLKADQANQYQTALTTRDDNKIQILTAYEDAYNNIVSIFLNLPDNITLLNKTLYGTDISDSEISLNNSDNSSVYINTIISSHTQQMAEIKALINQAKTAEAIAQTEYNSTFSQYGKINRDASQSSIDLLLANTINTARLMADAFKAETTMVDYWIKYRTDRDLSVYNVVSNYQTNLRAATSEVNNNLSSLLTIQKNIKNYQDSLVQAEKNIADMDVNNPLNISSAERAVQIKQQSLDDLKKGATELQINSKKLTVQQKQNSLTDAQQNYNDYIIKAPFAGTVTNISVLPGDSVTGSTVIATLLTDQKVVDLKLNEIDAAQVKTGQKAIITFDAIKDLSLTGKVVQIGSIGTVNSGVVSYDVQIVLDVIDERVKSGLSASVAIITDAKQNILAVPISAVKSLNGSSYVEVLVNGQPERRNITTGISDDTMIEVVSGLSVGDPVITQTVQNTTVTPNTSSGTGNFGGSGANVGGQLRLLR